MTLPRLEESVRSARRATKPKEEDFRLAQSFAARIAKAGEGKVRRVVMIGSRAGGYARADSDLDLVAIVELPTTARPWNGSDADAERDRIQAALGLPPISTDLTVRSAEQFEEARSIIGGVERLVETEGIDVYLEPFERPARARRSREDVRAALVRAWVEAASNSITSGVRDMRSGSSGDASVKKTTLAILPGVSESEGVLRFVVRPTIGKRDPASYLSRAIRQAITVLEVLYQVEAAKHDTVKSVLAKLDAFCPSVTRDLRRTIEAQGASLRGAQSILQLVLSVLPAAIRKSPWCSNLKKQLNAQIATA